MSAQQQVHHLWAACSQSLQRSLHNSGAHILTDPKALMEDIRMLAVKRKNNLVNIVELQRMGQGAQETITQYTSRLMGQGDICDFTIQCSECEHDFSFRDRIIMYQFIRGLADVSAQERILETAAQVEGGELSLARVLKIAEAFEMGRASQQLMNQGGQLSRLSEYKLKKNNARQDSRPNSAANKKDKDKDTKCGNCGQSGHLSKLSDRRKSCPAFDQTCSKCQTNGTSPVSAEVAPVLQGLTDQRARRNPKSMRLKLIHLRTPQQS